MAKWLLLYHIVWTTRHRTPLLTEDMEQFLHRILAVKAHELEGHAFAVNGMPDHIHVIASLPPKISVAAFIGKLKGYSSRVASLEFDIPFEWQHGYGVFTISHRNLKLAIEYVERQKEHHAAGTVVRALEYTSDDEEPRPGLSSKN